MSKDAAAHTPNRLCSGIEGIDNILGGGLTPHRMYLVEGAPGTGKTTLALQFLLQGVEEGQAGLYITLSETRSELISVADSHGWDLSHFHILELLSDEGLDPQFEQTVLHPAEVELGETRSSLCGSCSTVCPSCACCRRTHCATVGKSSH
jgi:circadian clock protein KaiC